MSDEPSRTSSKADFLKAYEAGKQSTGAFLGKREIYVVVVAPIVLGKFAMVVRGPVFYL